MPYLAHLLIVMSSLIQQVKKVCKIETIICQVLPGMKKKGIKIVFLIMPSLFPIKLDVYFLGNNSCAPGIYKLLMSLSTCMSMSNVHTGQIKKEQEKEE